MLVRKFNSQHVPVAEDPVFLERYPGKKKFQFLDIEIGCGVGMHPMAYAQANPERFLVALEHTREKYRKFKQSLETMGGCPANLYPVHGNAISWITHLIQAPETVDRYFFLYPNPNPKKNDLSKRWYAAPFFHYLLWTLKKGGEVHLATNESFYAEQACQYFAEFWKLELSKKTVFSMTSVPEFKPRTHFEKKYFERGDTLFDLVFINK